MLHCKSHNIEATCHICNVTFRRLTSLSTRLDNAPSPPLCKKCLQSFSNMWELNNPAKTHCMDSVKKAPSVIYQNSDIFSGQEIARRNANSESRPQQRTEMRPETSENSVEYIVGVDDKDIKTESDCDREDDSTTSESGDEIEIGSKCTKAQRGDPELDLGSGSDSTEHSSDSSNNPPSKKTSAICRGPRSRRTPAFCRGPESTMCLACGRGPFKTMKLHLLHCSGVKVKYPCSLCKEVFPNEAALKEHYMPLYTCDVCGQVFPLEKLYNDHKCPKGSRSPLVLFCSESRPQACNICKSFFVSEKSLSNHVNKVHMSVVSTKVCIITNPAALADKNASLGVHRSAAPSVISPNVANQVINGKLCIGQMNVGTQSTVTKSNPAPASTSSSQQVTSPAQVCVTSAGERLTSETDSSPSQPASRALRCPPTSATDPATAPTPTILAMFENGSHNLELMKRMNTGWRSKAPHPCRQCGAIFRQPSLIISHRYLHRGRRSHRCHCGRAFKHQLHLLRHCVQHAETVSYICVGCGETFIGAKLLEEHVRGQSGKRSRSGHKWKPRVKRKCRVPFTCDCGQLFFRPSAFIWHQLRNRTKTKRLKSS